ncbi:MAG: GntR family transcriptional regulator [Pseudomonadota bacterium]
MDDGARVNDLRTKAMVSRPAPRYAAIQDVLERAVSAGRLLPGTVLSEGSVARLFGTSRTPVRMALVELAARGVLGRFEGRGFVVLGRDPRDGPGPGPIVPRRVQLSRSALGLPAEPPSAPQPGSAERIAEEFERVVALALPFGRYRINEQAAADHFAVSRTVVRELLTRFQDRGLVRKDLRSHWVFGPLTARDVAHFFAIRGRLEPLALAESAPQIGAADLAGFRDRLDSVLSAGVAQPDSETLSGLEQDLHNRMLARSPNRYLLRMIHQSQVALTVNRVFSTFARLNRFDLALREHAIVLEFVMRGAYDAAGRALEEHLALSATRTQHRLKAISVFPEPDLPGYLMPQKR